MRFLKTRLIALPYTGCVVLGIIVCFIGFYDFSKSPKYSAELSSILILSAFLYFIFIASCRLRDAGKDPWLSIPAVLLVSMGLGVILCLPSVKD